MPALRLLNELALEITASSPFFEGHRFDSTLEWC